MRSGQRQVRLAVWIGIFLACPSITWGAPPQGVAVPRPPKEEKKEAAVPAAETVKAGVKAAPADPAAVFAGKGQPQHIRPMTARLLGLEGGGWPRHHDPDDPNRIRGIGRPLTGGSWRNRPYHIDWFFGGLFGDNLIDGKVGQDTNGFGGVRLGWDFDHYRSVEMRFAFARLGTTASSGASGESDVSFADGHYLYYPLGDTHFRPFVSLGMGFGTFDFVDHNGRGRSETLFQLPIGMGVKYRCSRWLALRGELVDNIAFGGGSVDVMHNVQLTIGMEMHFGYRRTSYFPFLNY